MLSDRSPIGLLLRRLLGLTRILGRLLNTLQPLVNQRITHNQCTSLLTLQFLLHQIHALHLLLLLLAVLFLLKVAVLLVLRHAAVLSLEFVESLKLTEHWINACNHVLVVSKCIRLIGNVSVISVLFATLETAGTSWHVLGVLLPREALKRLVEVFKLLVLLFTKLRIIEPITT